MLGRGAAVWNEWRAKHDDAPDLPGAGLRGLDLSGFDLSGVDRRAADLRGTRLCDADLSGAHLEGANFFKAVLDGADLAGAYLDGAQFLNCSQLVVTRNWRLAYRDETLGCGASIPDRKPQNRSIGPLRRSRRGDNPGWAEGTSRWAAGVARQIDELQHRAVGIVK
jgi:Pentapeptide repeats (8 copies)